MRNQILSEFRKVRTTRSVLALLLGTCILVVIGLAEPMINAPEGMLSETRLGEPLVSNAAVMAVMIFALVAGARSFADEFRYGQIVSTLLMSPDRRRVLAAKVAAGAAVGALLALAAAAVTLAVGIPWLGARGGSIATSIPGVAEWVGLMVLMGAMWSVMGVAIGLAVRHHVAAIVGALVWVLFAEALVGAVAGNDVRKVLPASAGRAIGIDEPALLHPPAGVLALMLWTIAALCIGALLMRRRDIT